MNFKILFTFFLLIAFTSCKQTNEQLFDEAYRLTKDKQFESAINIYNELILRNNKFQLAYFNRGHCYSALRQYASALADFNRVMNLQKHGDIIITLNKDTPYADEEAKAQVQYNDALYQRAQVNYHMDSLRSAFLDFKVLIDNNYSEKSNCLVWQGTIWVRDGKNEKACESFQKAKAVAITLEDSQEADDYIKEYCLQTNNNR
jgi:tetratricopeptide (TPR) repeat protein